MSLYPPVSAVFCVLFDRVYRRRSGEEVRTPHQPRHTMSVSGLLVDCRAATLRSKSLR